jgi:putative Ca2+/H+ antiporter (TMEM165/GDT1 family)
MLIAFLVAFGVVFLAEFGDKSQLLTLALATKYRPLPVLIAVTLSTMVLQALSVGIGGVIGAALPTTLISVLAGSAFIGFAIWTFAGNDDDDETKAVNSLKSSKHVIMAVGSMFFLAELGDKTMLSSITLATDSNLFGTWLGATVGMVCADGLAIVIGTVVGDRLPRKAIRIGSSAAFLVFGILMFIDVLQ